MKDSESRLGLLYGVGAFGIWGLLPLFWNLLHGVSPFEITVHRMLWCALGVGIVIALQGRLPDALAVLRNFKLVKTLAASAVLITINWTIFNWCVETRQLVEASLGYFINPLVVISLGVALLGERMSPARKIAIGLGVLAVTVQTLALGRFPVLALGLGSSFAFYGYLRKTANVGALMGLFVESLIGLPITLFFAVYWALAGTSAFLMRGSTTDILLVLCGPMTAIPLALFAGAARRLRFSTIGFLQYISPLTTLLIAVFVFHETVTWVNMVTFACVWAALALLALESTQGFFRNRPAERFAPEKFP